MGTDIHTWVETMTATGEWEIPLVDNPWFTPMEKRREYVAEHYKDWPAGRVESFVNDPGEWDTRERIPAEGFDDRNYGLFAILADVRNGYGFAGVETGEPTVPISEPRGVPEDASPQYLESVARWNGDGHSHTWFSLAELLAYDWDGNHSVNSMLVHPRGSFRAQNLPELPPDFDFSKWAIEVELVLNVQGEEAAYERWPALGMCGGVSGNGAHEWRRVKWKVSHRQQAGEGWFEFLETTRKQAEAAGKDPQQVRIVLFFDN